jgi:hypothetical protein
LVLFEEAVDCVLEVGDGGALVMGLPLIIIANLMAQRVIPTVR